MDTDPRLPLPTRCAEPAHCCEKMEQCKIIWRICCSLVLSHNREGRGAHRKRRRPHHSQSGQASVLTSVKISDLSTVRRSQESGRTLLPLDAQESGPEQVREKEVR